MNMDKETSCAATLAATLEYPDNVLLRKPAGRQAQPCKPKDVPPNSHMPLGSLSCVVLQPNKLCSYCSRCSGMMPQQPFPPLLAAASAAGVAAAVSPMLRGLAPAAPAGLPVACHKLLWPMHCCYAAPQALTPAAAAYAAPGLLLMRRGAAVTAPAALRTPARQQHHQWQQQ